METTERIVESYCRYVKGWFTISNIRCSGQYEIDLLAVEPPINGNFNRYHIESGISISGAYSKLTTKPFSPEKLKERANKAAQRRTIGYFIQRKFGSREVITELNKYGFREGNYTKIIVSWGWKPEVKEEANRVGVILWDFRDILKEIEETCGDKKTYFIDDTLRTVQLFVKKGHNQKF